MKEKQWPHKWHEAMRRKFPPLTHTVNVLQKEGRNERKIMRKVKMKRKGMEQTRERRKRIREEKMGKEKLEKKYILVRGGGGGGGGGGEEPTIRWRAKRKKIIIKGRQRRNKRVRERRREKKKKKRKVVQIVLHCFDGQSSVARELKLVYSTRATSRYQERKDSVFHAPRG